MSYDLIVIGTGPGGYVCAIRAAQLGLKTAVVEKRKTHGGTCLNIGCIPSKALLHASEVFDEASHDFAALGIEVGKPKLDLAAMMKHKEDTVSTPTSRASASCSRRTRSKPSSARARSPAPGKVEVTAEDGSKQTLETKNIVIATGSDVDAAAGRRPSTRSDRDPPPARWSSAQVPEQLLVIGAGVIGLELGSVWRRLGAEVTVVEYLDRILPGMDSEVAKQFQRMLSKQGFDLQARRPRSPRSRPGKKGATVTVEPAAGGEADDAGGRRGAGRHRPPCPTRRASAWKRPA